MNYLNILKVVISLLPLLGQLIQAVEAMLPVSGQGTVKLDMVKNMLANAYSTMGTVTVAFDSVWSVLQPIVNGLVAVYKTNGTFAAHPAASPAPVQPVPATPTK